MLGILRVTACAAVMLLTFMPAVTPSAATAAQAVTLDDAENRYFPRSTSKPLLSAR